MKILLLGAAGFIGTNLTIELAKKTEDEITLVDRSKAFFKPIVSILIPRCLSQVVLDQMNRVLLLVPICGLDWSLGKESYICLVAGIDIGIYFHHEPKG